MMKKGIISFQDQKLHFADLASLRIQTGGKVWAFDHETANELRFKSVKMGDNPGAGDWLKEWRKWRVWTQARAAKEFGISQPHWALMENGKRHIPLNILTRVFEENRKAWKEEHSLPGSLGKMLEKYRKRKSRKPTA
jgi:DNA-binding XRE family transcriptional regulator